MIQWILVIISYIQTGLFLRGILYSYGTVPYSGGARRWLKFCGTSWHKVIGPIRHGPHPTAPVTLCQTAPQNIIHFHAPPSTVHFQAFGPKAQPNRTLTALNHPNSRVLSTGISIYERYLSAQFSCPEDCLTREIAASPPADMPMGQTFDLGVLIVAHRDIPEPALKHPPSDVL